MKEGHLVKSWKKRWFLLKDDLLFYFKSSENLVAPMGIIPLAGCKIKAVTIPEKEKKNLFKIYPKIEVVPPFLLSAENEVDMNEWIKAIKVASKLASHSTFIATSKEYSDTATASYAIHRGRSTTLPVGEKSVVRVKFSSDNVINFTERLSALKSKVDSELNEFVQNVKNTLLRLKLLNAGKSESSAPSTYHTSINAVHVLQRLKQISSSITIQSVESLIENHKNIIQEIQQLFKYPACNEYVARLLFILSPLSRLIDYFIYESNVQSSKENANALFLEKFGSNSSINNNNNNSISSSTVSVQTPKHSSLPIIPPATTITTSDTLFTSSSVSSKNKGVKITCRICEEDVEWTRMRDHSSYCELVNDFNLPNLSFEDQLKQLLVYFNQCVDSILTQSKDKKKKLMTSSLRNGSIHSSMSTGQLRMSGHRRVSSISDSFTMEEEYLDISIVQSKFVTIITKISQFSYGSHESVNQTEDLLSELKILISAHTNEALVQIFGKKFVKIVRF